MSNRQLLNDSSLLELEIVRERIRQAHHSFNLALGATIASLAISLIGAGLLLTNKVSEGSVTAAIGLMSSFSFMKLCKDTNDRLDRFHVVLSNHIGTVLLAGDQLDSVSVIPDNSMLSEDS